MVGVNTQARMAQEAYEAAGPIWNDKTRFKTDARAHWADMSSMGRKYREHFDGVASMDGLDV